MPLQAYHRKPPARASAPRPLLLAVVLASALLIPLTGTLNAKTTDAPPITVNGSQSSVSGIEQNDTTFVPIRGIFEKIGAKVAFTAPATIKATRNGAEIARLTVGSRDGVMNGSTVRLAAAPFIANGIVMVPLRFISEAAGAAVTYAANPRNVQVTHSTATAAVSGAAAAAAAGAGTVATAATAAPAVDTPANGGGIPWWVWLLAALIIIGLIAAFMRRKKEPLIMTSSTGHDTEPVIKTRN